LLLQTKSKNSATKILQGMTWNL